MFLKKCLIFLVAAIFSITSLSMPNAQAGEMVLPLMPAPGTRVNLSPTFNPAHLNGMVVHPTDALKFDFLIKQGDGNLNDEQKQLEYKKLIKYFLAALTVPEKNQWVNLSPYEKERIIQNDFGKTEMGRDLLSQDYLLKQIASSMMYPESELGKKFWDEVYARANQAYGTTNIPVNTFNKVWIVPEEAVIYEKDNTAMILKSTLKVMLEEDYLSLHKHNAIQTAAPEAAKLHPISSKVVKEIILPMLNKEVNEGKNFAMLRQVYSGMILAAWYKKSLKQSVLGKVYMDKAKVAGIDQDPKNNQAIYEKYLAAFKKGVYNYIKDDFDPYANQMIPRKYFAGGFDPAMTAALKVVGKVDQAQLPPGYSDGIDRVAATLDRAQAPTSPVAKQYEWENNRMQVIYKDRPILLRIAGFLDLQIIKVSNGIFSNYVITDGKKWVLTLGGKSITLGREHFKDLVDDIALDRISRQQITLSRSENRITILNGAEVEGKLFKEELRVATNPNLVYELNAPGTISTMNAQNLNSLLDQERFTKLIQGSHTSKAGNIVYLSAHTNSAGRIIGLGRKAKEDAQSVDIKIAILIENGERGIKPMEVLSMEIDDGSQAGNEKERRQIVLDEVVLEHQVGLVRKKLLPVKKLSNKDMFTVNYSTPIQLILNPGDRDRQQELILYRNYRTGKFLITDGNAQLLIPDQKDPTKALELGGEANQEIFLGLRFANLAPVHISILRDGDKIAFLDGKFRGNASWSSTEIHYESASPAELKEESLVEKRGGTFKGITTEGLMAAKRGSGAPTNSQGITPLRSNREFKEHSVRATTKKSGVNEDTVFVDRERRMIIVADGVGGHNAGDVASQMAVDFFVRELTAETLRKFNNEEEFKKHLRGLTSRINDAIAEEASNDDSKAAMATTLSLAVIWQDPSTRQDKIIILNIGDSRVYLYADRQLKQITKDDSWVQQLIDSGVKMTPEEAELHLERNQITAALGQKMGIELSDTQIQAIPYPGGSVFAISDGYHDNLGQDRMAAIAAQAGSFSDFIDKLSKEARRIAEKVGLTPLEERYSKKDDMGLAGLENVDSDPSRDRASTSINPLGGIDLDSANMSIDIQRDGRGVVLPLMAQDMAQLGDVTGFEPVILDIKPLGTLPLQGGLIPNQ